MTYFPDIIAPDKKIRVFFSEGNVNNEVAHIRAIVDDSQVVLRVWSKRKKRWIYKIESMVYLRMLYDNDNLQAA